MLLMTGVVLFSAWFPFQRNDGFVEKSRAVSRVNDTLAARDDKDLHC